MANTETTINAIINPQTNDTPIDIEKTIKALERNNFVVHYFEIGIAVTRHYAPWAVMYFLHL